MVASQTGFSSVQREMIAFAFQFGSLILPTVVPAATWVVTHRALLERLRSVDGDEGQSGVSQSRAAQSRVTAAKLHSDPQLGRTLTLTLPFALPRARATACAEPCRSSSWAERR